jgi:hypothetical protein
MEDSGLKKSPHSRFWMYTAADYERERMGRLLKKLPFFLIWREWSHRSAKLTKDPSPQGPIDTKIVENTKA